MKRLSLEDLASKDDLFLKKEARTFECLVALLSTVPSLLRIWAYTNPRKE
jgi:hypothetical protein